MKIRRGEPSAVLTETGKGGLLSQGYLRDAPAGAYVGEGETVAFVLTDDESRKDADAAGEEREEGTGETTDATATDTDGDVDPRSTATPRDDPIEDGTTVDDAPVDPADDGHTEGNSCEPNDAAVRSRPEVEAALRGLSPPEFDRLVTAVVEAMGWRPEPTASAAVDYLARREDATSGTLAVVTFPDEDGEAMTPETIRECATLATSVLGVDDVMIVTTRPLPAAAMNVARERDLRVLDVEYLASALAGPEAADVGTVVPTAGD